MFKQYIVACIAMIFVWSTTGCANRVEEAVDVSVVAMKGATAMGMVGFMDGIDQGITYENTYDISILTAIDEVTALLAKGEVDIAALPANLASVLYANTDGGIQVVAMNTLGVLYVMENGDTITHIDSLRGRTIVASGKGSTPEMALRYILLENGIDPDVDVTIEWKSEQSECLAYVLANEGAIAMLPEPFATTAMQKNEQITRALDLTKEWNMVSEESSMITGVVVARTEFTKEHPQAMEEFLKEYDDSVQYVNEFYEEAATLIDRYDIVPYETAVQAIPNCNIVCIQAEEMKKQLEGYLTVLYKQNPKSVGGSLPDNDFYYIP